MSDTSTTGRGAHFDRLVEFIADVPSRIREANVERWGAESPRPIDVAEAWCERPERVLEAVDSADHASECWQILEDLGSQHDIWIDIGWSSPEARRDLFELGLLRPKRSGKSAAGENSLPAAVATILAPRLKHIPATYPSILGGLEESKLRQLADYHGVPEPAYGHVRLALRLADHLGQQEVIEQTVMQLPGPEYVGPALMALELGGVCYWREVFGHDVGGDSGGNVVPLMRSDVRDYERDMADALLEAGLLFRLEVEDQLPMLVLPEELWSMLWNLGRDWLMEWTSATVATVEKQAIRRGDGRPGPGLQPAMKWLVLEAERENLRLDDGDLTSSSLEHLVELGGGGEDDWPRRFGLASELGAFGRDDDLVVVNESIGNLLDLARRDFQRSVLFEWVVGYVGSRADRRMPSATGLDDVWRENAVEILEEADEFVPRWMRSTGVRPEITGAGILRNNEDSTPDQMMLEISVMNGLTGSEKLVWLDLLSQMEGGCWYPMGMVTELLQLSCAFTVFSHVIHVLDRPDMALYYPVQRASFLTDPIHDDEFAAWAGDIVDELLVPIGVARRDEDAGTVWLDTEALRVESPPGVTDEHRRDLLADLLNDPDLTFAVSSSGGSRLREVTEPPDDDVIDLDAPLAVLRQQIGDREIASFDGGRLRLE